MTKDNGESEDATEWDQEKMRLIYGLCCLNALLYCDMPECVGCSFSGECLCCVEKGCLRCGNHITLYDH